MSQAYDESPEIDLQSLEKLTYRLQEALADYQKDPSNLYVLDSVIKRFELTYELATRSLRRYLIEYSISKSEVVDMSFAGIIRRGDREGLLRTGWPEWNKYREARNETVHAYQEENARKTAVDAALFLPEAEYLLDNLRGGWHPMIQHSLDLAPGDLALVQDILAKFVPERPVFVFGSRATGKAKRRSDLDLCIGGEAPLERGAIGNLMDAFDESDLPIEVDVIDLAEATGVFRKRVLGEAIPFPLARQTDEAQVAA